MPRAYHTRLHLRPRRAAIATTTIAAAMVLLASCRTPEEAVAEVDAEAYAVLAAKQEALFGEARPFDVAPPAGRVAAQAVDPATRLADPAAAVTVTLEDALALAAVNSRDFQAEKETLYRAVLALLRERKQFRWSPFAFLSGSATESADTTTVAAGSDFGVTKLLERGGAFALNVGLSFLRIVSAPTAEDLVSDLSLSISLPFLRNAGREVVLENLTQAERDALYALRDFERFKQVYGVQVISAYLDTLTRQQQVRNAEANLESLRFARARNDEFFAVGRIAKIEVDQARQQELSGENRLVLARQDAERSLDALKDLIGLPVDLRVEVRIEDLEGLEGYVQEDAPFDLGRLMRVAVRSRYDLRNAVDGVEDASRRVRVAENLLLPDLTLDLSASAASQALKPLKYNFNEGVYSAAVAFDLPLDREIESITLRSALLDLQRAVRDQEAAAEQVKLDVRNALRRLDQARETFAIAKNAVVLAEVRVESSRDLLELGQATTRDFLESQESLISSQNNLVEALVDYRVAYLELFRDTGALVVAPGGLDHETTRALLLEG